ncbi:putative primosomal protein N' [Actinocatenispora sera]|uniref:Probable replication restart protein PriA n=1 Tax=Actinocatenispora sera TaxID=390989 RepID=A0A810L636_9ACTN|nr:putative primosomal protein N' [Actinocatenispora sera]
MSDDQTLPLPGAPTPPTRTPARRAPARRPTRARTAAAELPVAQVAVDVGLAHLDRPFDYLVPADLAEAAVPGCRVRVRFGGQLADGFVLARVADTDFTGRLGFLERVVSAVPVLAPEVVELARAVADRYGGTLADVLRLAVPPRHARAERAKPEPPPIGPVAPPDGHGWRGYPAGPAYLRALADGRAPRAVLTALPGDDWAARLADALTAVAAGGRGGLAVVPDARDLDRLDAALTARLGTGRHVAIAASLGPEQRYRRFLRAVRGEVPVVIGTRAAMFAPVPALGLVAIFDDGDDLHADDHAPYPHAREVLLTRAQQTGAAALLAGYARSAEAQLLLATGWAKPIDADRAALRAAAPRVIATGDEFQLSRDPSAAAARLPGVAVRAAREALAAGTPVLVQVPRRGYLPVVVCQRCRARTRCPRCAGPLAVPAAGGFPVCRWCGHTAGGYRCPECGGRELRAAVIGARRTAEELGRAFPGAVVRTSGRDGVLATVHAEPAVVVSTPGAEPVAVGGYGAVLLLDSWALLTRADLRAAEETLRRWLAAAVLARPADAGGRVVVVADASVPVVQALVRFDAAGFAERELADRRALGFPPAVRMASLTGTAPAIAELLAAATLPDGTDELGPVPVPTPRAAPDAPERERLLLRVPRPQAPALAAALRAATAVRSARKGADPVRVQIDPLDLL